MKFMQSNKNTISNFFSEKAFLISIFLLASMYTMKFSQLDYIPAMKYVMMLMRLLSYGLVAIKFLYDFFGKRYQGYELFILISGLYMAFIAYNSRTVNYFVYFVYIIVGKDVNYLSIIKTAFIAIFSFSVFVILLYVLGFIEEDLHGLGGRNRHSLGFKYAPLLSNFCFYSILYYIYIRKNRMRVFEILIAFIINIVIFVFTNTKSAFAFGCLALIMVFFINNVKCFKTYNKVYTYVMYALSFALPIFAVVLTYVYDPNNAVLKWMNGILTDRLELGKAAITKYGFKLFGQYIHFTDGLSGDAPYNIVDSAYVLYLLILGIIFFIIMIALFCYFAKLIEKKKDVYMFCIFTILLCHSTFDGQIFHLSNSYFMFLWSYKNSLVEYG